MGHWETLSILSRDVEAIAFCDVRSQDALDWQGFQGQVLELNHTVALPFDLTYKTPQTLGADRMACVAGALALHPDKNVLVIDAGTCLKFEMLTKDKVYLGGSISPGLAMRYNALHHFTGRLPLIDHRDWEEAWGQSTEESILAGVQHGYLGETEKRIAQFSGAFDDLNVIVTGGDASFLADRLKTRIFAEPLLIHHGLLYCLLNQ